MSNSLIQLSDQIYNLGQLHLQINNSLKIKLLKANLAQKVLLQILTPDLQNFSTRKIMIMFSLKIILYMLEMLEQTPAKVMVTLEAWAEQLVKQ